MDRIRARMCSPESAEDAILFVVLSKNIDINSCPFAITYKVMAFLRDMDHDTQEDRYTIGQVNVWSIVLYLFKACDWTVFENPHRGVRTGLYDDIASIFWSCYELFLKVQCTTDHDAETRQACLEFLTEDVAVALRHPCTEAHNIVNRISIYPYVEETFTFFLPLLGADTIFMDRGSVDPQTLYLLTVRLRSENGSDNSNLLDTFTVWLENSAPKNYFTTSVSASFDGVMPQIVLHKILWSLLYPRTSDTIRRVTHTFLSSARKIIERDLSSPEEWNEFLTKRHYHGDGVRECPWVTLGDLLEPFPELAALVSPGRRTKSANT